MGFRDFIRDAANGVVDQAVNLPGDVVDAFRDAVPSGPGEAFAMYNPYSVYQRTNPAGMIASGANALGIPYAGGIAQAVANPVGAVGDAVSAVDLPGGGLLRNIGNGRPTQVMGDVLDTALGAAAPSGILAAIQQRSPRPLAQIPQGYADTARGVYDYAREVGQNVQGYPEYYKGRLAQAAINLREHPTDPRAYLNAAATFGDPYLKIANDPIERIHESQGEGAYYVATNNGRMRNVDAAQPFNYAVNWAMEHPEEHANIAAVYKGTYDANQDGVPDYAPGGKGVWEYYIGKQDRATRIAAETTNDPWNLTLLAGGVEAGAGKLGTRLVERGAPEFVGTGVRGAGRAVKLVDEGIQGVLDLPFTGTTGAARMALETRPGQAVAGAVGKAVPGFVKDLARETLMSQRRRSADEAATELGNLGNDPLADQGLPSWATPVDPSPNGEYRAVLASPPDDPTFGRNTGAAYIVDPNGNPVPGFTDTGKGAHSRMAKAANQININPKYRPQGVMPEDLPYAGRNYPSGDVAQEPLINRSPMDQQFTTPPTTQAEVDAGITEPGAPAAPEPRPTWVDQTQAERRASIENDGLTIYAPNLGDRRLSTVVEQLRPHFPKEAQAFEIYMGLDPVTGNPMPGTPYGKFQQEFERIRDGQFFGNDEGGLARKVAEQKMFTAQFTLEQQVPIFKQTFGWNERPQLTGLGARDFNDQVADLFSRDSTREAAGVGGLLERMIFDEDLNTRAQAFNALEAFMDAGNDWLQPYIDHAAELGQWVYKHPWEPRPPMAPPPVPAPEPQSFPPVGGLVPPNPAETVRANRPPRPGDPTYGFIDPQEAAYQRQQQRRGSPYPGGPSLDASFFEPPPRFGPVQYEDPALAQYLDAQRITGSADGIEPPPDLPPDLPPDSSPGGGGGGSPVGPAPAPAPVAPGGGEIRMAEPEIDDVFDERDTPFGVTKAPDVNGWSIVSPRPSKGSARSVDAPSWLAVAPDRTVGIYDVTRAEAEAFAARTPAPTGAKRMTRAQQAAREANAAIYAQRDAERRAREAAAPTPVERMAPALGEPGNPKVMAPEDLSRPVSAMLSAPPDTNTVMVPTASLSTDPSRFQPRAGLDENNVRGIADAWDINRLDPLTVWTDPANGRTYVIAGHHRLEAARRLGVEELPVRQIRATEDEARNMAALSNTQKPHTDLEQAGVVARLREQGMSIRAIASKMGKGTNTIEHWENLNYAPQIVKDLLHLREISLSEAGAVGDAVKRGVVSKEEAAVIYQKVKEQLKRRPTQAELNAIFNASTALSTRGATMSALFDMNGGDFGSYAGIAQIDRLTELGERQALLEGMIRDAKRLTRKSQQGGIDLAGMDQNIEKLTGELDKLVAELTGGPTTPLPPNGGTTMTDLGPQYNLPGMPTHELPSPTVQNNEELFLEHPGIPEEDLTPAQLRDRERAAGQQDMFGIIAKSDPKFQRYVDNLAGVVRSLDGFTPPSGDSLIDNYLRVGRLTPERAEILRTVYPGMEFSLFEEYLGRLRNGLSPYEARKSIRDAIYQTGFKPVTYSKNKVWRTVQKGLGYAGELVDMARQNMMYNIFNLAAGSLGDLVGNAMHLLITGKPHAVFNTIDTAHVALGGEHAIADAYSKEFDEVFAGADRNMPDSIIPRSGQLYETKIGTTDDSLVAWRWAKGINKKLTGRDDLGSLSKFALNMVASPRSRTIRQGIDANSKSALFKTLVDDQLDGQVERFSSSLADAGLPVESTLDAIRKKATERASDGYRINNQGGTFRHFSPKDVRAVTGSDDLARKWALAQDEMWKNATDQVRHTYFAGAKRYGIDDAIGQVFFYHYWQTRSLGLQAREMLRNPRVLGLYYRAIQGAMNEADRNGYPDTFRGMLHYWGDTTAGWYGLFNPLGVIVPAMMFSDLAAAQNEKGWGKFSSILPVSPIVSAAVAALGVSDDTPYILGTARVQNLVTDLVNWGNAHGYNFLAGVTGEGIVGDPIQMLTQKTLRGINGLLRAAGLDRRYQPYNQVTGKQDTVKEVALTLMRGAWGPMDQWTPEQRAEADDAMTAIETGGRGNPWADQAFEQWADANARNRLAGMVLPQGSVLRYGPREVVRNDRRTDSPTSENSQLQYDIATLAPDARALRIAQENLADLGTPEQQALYEGYNLIAYGDAEDANPQGMFEVYGQQIPMAQLVGLTPQDRRALADKWVDQLGGTQKLKEYRKQRDAYIKSNPALASYDQYTDTIRDFPGSTAGFRAWARQVSDEFKVREEAERKKERAKGKTGAVLEAELDNWARSYDAYFGFRGQRESIYDPAPRSGAKVKMTPEDVLALVAQLRGGGGQQGGQQQAIPGAPFDITGGYTGRVTW